MRIEALTYKNFKERYGSYTAEEQIIDDHILNTSSALNDALVSTAETANQISNTKSKVFLINGAVRRLTMIRSSFLSLTEVAPLYRSKPLSPEEIKILEIHLNSLLINLQGTIDCFLWTLLYESKVNHTLYEKKPLRVKFNQKFLEELSLKDGQNKHLLTFEGWLGDFKLKRNAAAHKIPFYIPPAILNTQKDLDRDRELKEQLNEAMSKLELEKCKHIYDELESMGTFLPFFAQDHTQTPYPLYPTIPDDVCQLLNLASVFTDCLKHPPPSKEN